MDLDQVDVVHVRRFNERVDRAAGIEGCWPWTGTVNRQGYGHLSHGRGATILAHRLAHYLSTGDQPENVCHHCDNPPCCNEQHLFAGTRAENQHDKRRKGRAARGSANGGGGKLTDEDVRAIRVRLAAGELQRYIGALFGVSQVQISYIARGVQWAHVR